MRKEKDKGILRFSLAGENGDARILKFQWALLNAWGDLAELKANRR